MHFDAGSLSRHGLNSILNTLPLDMTFVDKDGNVKYFAIRDEESNYLGTLEVTQNIKPIRDLEGEKRLMSK